MERAQNLVVTHAKSQHLRGASLSREAVLEHEDLQGTGSPRFFTWSAKLVNSIHAEKVKVFVNGIKGEVTAGERYATKIELGGPNRRAFPFMGPALVGTAPATILLFAAAVKKVIK